MITPEAIAKAMKTRADRHGGDPMAQVRTEEACQKRHDSLQRVFVEKYGGWMGHCHVPEIQAKVRVTLKERYGSVAGRLLDPESKQKSAQTRSDRYGYSAACMNTPEANAKSLATRQIIYNRKRSVSKSVEFKEWFAPLKSEYHLPKDAVTRFLRETGRKLEDYPEDIKN